jgi:hypothetical protein
MRCAAVSELLEEVRQNCCTAAELGLAFDRPVQKDAAEGEDAEVVSTLMIQVVVTIQPGETTVSNRQRQYCLTRYMHDKGSIASRPFQLTWVCEKWQHT